MLAGGMLGLGLEIKDVVRSRIDFLVLVPKCVKVVRLNEIHEQTTKKEQWNFKTNRLETTLGPKVCVFFLKFGWKLVSEHPGVPSLTLFPMGPWYRAPQGGVWGGEAPSQKLMGGGQIPPRKKRGLGDAEPPAKWGGDLGGAEPPQQKNEEAGGRSPPTKDSNLQRVFVKLFNL